MTQGTALIIDDEPDIRRLIAIILERMNLKCEMAANFSESIALLAQGPFSFCITDMKLPDGNGLDIIRECQYRYPQMPVAMITAFGNVEIAVEALKAGAFDFVNKPIDNQRLRELVQNALKLEEEHKEADPESSSPLLGQSPRMQELNDRIRKVARTQAPVFIHGESGTGKELVARQIHELSPRSNSPFIAVNCGAIPSELMESEFFGHKRGAFTGANQDKDGFFRAAEGGTLFLDEVADLPKSMQAKLLRAIQEKAVLPVGSEVEVPVNIRLLSASHMDLSQRAREDLFRQDLLFRLDVIRIEMPVLRDRTEDIPQLANHFIKKYVAEWGMPPSELTQSALKALQSYHYPGNVRELENILQRAVTLADSCEIDASALNLAEASTQPIEARTSAALKTSPQERPLNPESLNDPLNEPDNPDMEIHDLEGYLAQREKEIITAALQATKWNKTAAAEKLGVSFRALRYKCKKLGID